MAREHPAGRSHTGLIIGLVVGGVLLLGVIITVVALALGTAHERVRVAADRATSQNNLKQIGLAMLMYHDTYGRFPPAVVYGPGGKPLYSWRVLLLPYLEEQPLYQEFHLNEAWDSPNNLTLLARMPKVYAHPRSPSTTDTHYQVFFGRGAAFEAPMNTQLVEFRLLPAFPNQMFEGPSTRIADITDGLTNTILVAEAAQAVPWSKPADLPFDANGPLPQLGGLFPDEVFNVCMGDASVLSLDRKKISDQTLRAAITRAGGEVLGKDWGEEQNWGQ
jgi:hypothetical protein